MQYKNLRLYIQEEVSLLTCTCADGYTEQNMDPAPIFTY